jgi:hypothetical protein
MGKDLAVKVCACQVSELDQVAFSNVHRVTVLVLLAYQLYVASCTDLGVSFDYRVFFSPHVCKMVANAYSIVFQVTLLASIVMRVLHLC